MYLLHFVGIFIVQMHYQKRFLHNKHKKKNKTVSHIFPFVPRIIRLKCINIFMDTNLITMAFMNTVLEAVHAHNTSGIYCTIPARTVKEICYLNIQMSNSQVSG